ncbi:hypothetical protein B0H19DRAFT_1181751, partial [Mycena capillaripes]
MVGQRAVHVSRHRHFAPIASIIDMPLFFLRSFTCHVTFLMLIPHILIFLIQNFILSLTWVYYRIVEQDLDDTSRISSDLGTVTYRINSLRVQIISIPGAPQFTLATFPPISHIVVNRLPALSPVQSAALFAALDLEDQLKVVVIELDSALSLNVVLNFIHWHQSLVCLILERGAIDSASLAEEPMSDVYGGITSLTCPAGYIPYILPTQRSVAALTITSAADCQELAHALNIIASDPDSRVKWLTL